MLRRFNHKIHKEVTNKDLQEEIRQYKLEVQELRQYANLVLINSKTQNDKISSNKNQEILESSKVNEESSHSYLNIINKVNF